MKRFPRFEISLPWKTANGPKVTQRLTFTATAGRPGAWKSALAAAGVIPAPEAGEEQPSPATPASTTCVLRRFYASDLLDAGDSITALAEYLGTRIRG